MNFVLRDSPGGFVNVTCWGTDQYVNDLSNNFGIGDIGKLRHNVNYYNGCNSLKYFQKITFYSF